MSKFAKNHHFVSQGYLAPFTDNGSKDGRLCVFDLMANRFFKQKPKNVAFEIDFNRVEMDGERPDSLEKAFGKFESEAISRIRDICNKDRLPGDDNEFSYVYNLITLYGIRNPRMRRNMSASRKHVVRMMMGLLTSEETSYKNHVGRARKDGFVTGPDVPFERIKHAVNDEAYSIIIDRQEHIDIELRNFDSILRTVAGRSWSLLIADDSAPDFITCDHPVELRRKEILFTLGRRHALIGSFTSAIPRTAKVLPRGVADINTQIMGQTDRQIYSFSPNIAVLSESHQGDPDARSF